MDSSSMIVTELAAIRSENKQIIKLLRKLKSVQDDPDGIKAKERASKNGFSKPLEVSEKLRMFLALGDDEKISRSEVTKRVSAYVKEQGLKHPENGRVIVLDEKLTTLLSPPVGEQITFLNIQRYLSPHYIKPVPVVIVIPSHPAAADQTGEPPVAAKRPVIKKKPVAT